MAVISVIIPVYNVEPYLDCCLESVINQTFKDIEIICVDDCSTDKSKSIISEWLTLDDRIHLVSTKKNSGLSAARNTGLEVASGTYIYFLDSDDWIDSHYLEAMLNKMEECGCEMIINSNAIGVYNGQFNVQWAPTSPDGEYWDRISTINKKYYNVWGHLYKRDFLNRYSLRFPEGYIYEDSYFYHMILAYVMRVFAFQGPAYFYRKRSNSITSTVNSKYPLLKISYLLVKFYNEHPDLDCNGIKFYDNRIISKLTSDEEVQDFRKFYKKNLSLLLRRGFHVDEYDKFLFKCLFSSSNLVELNQRIAQKKAFSFFDSAQFFWILLYYSKSKDGYGKLKSAKHLLWKAIKDYLNQYIKSDSWVRRVYRTLRSALQRVR